MKRILAVVSFISFLAVSGQLFAVGYNVYSALIYVYDQDGNPLAGIPVSLFVQTWYGIDQEYTCLQNGTTGGNGSAYLECWIPEQYSMGLDFMVANMTDQGYTIISSQNTFTSTASAIYPVFDIGLDSDGNGIFDGWEMPLAQKFCPVLFTPLKDAGDYWSAPGVDYTLRPVPVEAMDLNGDSSLDQNDVLVQVYNIAGNALGHFPMDDVEVFDHVNNEYYPYSDFYPANVMKRHEVQGKVNGVPSIYFYLPHYEWANTDSHEGNSSWYGKWNDLFYQKGVIQNNTWYVDGTIYAFFEFSGGTCKILFNMHFPFNAAANRHEGDWAGILVELDSQQPDDAEIISVEYRFHEENTVRTIGVNYSYTAAEALHDEVFWDDGNNNPAFANKYFVIDGTHPVTFGGGRTDEGGVKGWGSHAQYPSPGIWKRQKLNIFTVITYTIEEYVVETGHISNETANFDFNNYQNIKIVPPRDYVYNNLKDNPEYNWLIFGGWWGDVFSYPSGEEGFWGDLVDFIELIINGFGTLGFADVQFIPDANLAAVSPYGGYYDW